MRSEIRLFLCVVCCAGLIAHCSGPSPVETAGGDDFPNMIAKSGPTISESIESSWINPAGAETGSLSLIKKTIPSTGSISAGVSKISVLSKIAATDSTSIRFDSVSGNYIFTHKKSTVLKTTCDTIIFKVDADDTSIVSVSGSVEPVSSLSPTEFYRFSDIDGDSLLISSTASRQQARAYYTKTGALNTLTIQQIDVDAGEDRDFADSSDNGVMAAQSLILQNGDTLAFSTLTDADGDGFLQSGASASDSSIIDIVSGRFEVIQVSALNKTITHARMVAFTNDSLKNYAIRYNVVNEFAARTVTWSIHTIQGDSTFFPGDTVTVKHTTATAGNDTLTSDTLITRCALGSTPADSADDALLSIYSHSQFNRANEKDIIFDFSADPAVFNGQPVQGGTFRCIVQVRDGVWYKLEGSIDESRIVAEATASNGAAYTVIWNRDGSLVSIRKQE